MIVVVVFVAASSSVAQEEAPEELSLPFKMPTPPGWREETIPFPLGFAPGLEYEGVEVLRFAPGMFDPDAHSYWTYAFVWWVSDRVDLNANTIARDLEAYFRGLTTAVAESREFDPGEVSYTADLEPIESSGSRRRLHGEVVTYDPFAARQVVTLNARIEIWACGENQVAFFEFSPRSFDHEVWQSLGAIRDGFECTGGGE